MQPEGATSPPQLLRLEKATGIVRVTRLSLGPGSWSLRAGVSPWGLGTGTPHSRELGTFARVGFTAAQSCLSVSVCVI